MRTVQLSLRISRADSDMLWKLAQAADISVNRVAAALLHRALAEGWAIQPGTVASVVTPQDPPARSRSTPLPAGRGPDMTRAGRSSPAPGPNSHHQEG